MSGNTNHASQARAAVYTRFLAALHEHGFEGEIDRSHATRTVLATDNSIYQRHPRAAVFPRHTEDVQRIATLLAKPDFHEVVVAPRGGGTGTNGQSLTDGFVVDLSRHMNQILEIDPVKRTARVQAGVVKDQLNAALRPYGLFFAPELSTSNRATIGGMVNTDASGQGSCTYGKTRDHVLKLESLLIGGARLVTQPVNVTELEALCARDDRIGHVYRTARAIVDDNAALIVERFPPLNRCLTGYDLAHLRVHRECFDMNSVLCGSEGTLGILVEATLNVLPVPTFAMLVNVRYAGFLDALRDAQALMLHSPLSIETVDSTVLGLAREDIVWQSVAEFFPEPEDGDGPAMGINLVEFSGDSEQGVRARVDAFVTHLQSDTSVTRLGWSIAQGEAEVNRVYAMRKRAVGLLGNLLGEVRPQPFVEDTAVPPEYLADYIAEFRALLDSHGLRYGMFGHVDAGVLHVRPALNMRDPAQEALVRPISDAVAALTMKYGGLLWGEHGKGVRSEYVPQYFGPLYPCLQALKAAFDPHNQLNPGKIATPAMGQDLPAASDPGRQSPLSAVSTERPIALLRIDGVPTRGALDRRIDERVWQSYGRQQGGAVHCNGNGACYNYDPDDAMCPSWKATRSRIHSPKGRASLIREWLRLQGEAGVDVLAVASEEGDDGIPRVPAPGRGLRQWSARVVNTWRKHRGDTDFSHEVYDAMAGCLACKSCAGQCPVKVNVPDFRSRFLALYHTRYLRPWRDFAIGSLEFTLPYLAVLAGPYNAVMGARPVRSLVKQCLGLVDSPQFSRAPWQSHLRRWDVRGSIQGTPLGAARAAANLRHELDSLSPEQRKRSLVLVLDAFTRYFETPVVMAFVELAARLGYRVYLAPYMPNGKPLQVQGFLAAFARTARRHADMLNLLADTGVPLVGIDPAMTLVYRQEYCKVAGLERYPDVLLPQEWLRDALAGQLSATNVALRKPSPHMRLPRPSPRFRLLPHCTERTNAAASAAQWREVFEQAGLSLTIPSSGCCGMSGTYGHEARNVATSAQIFALSWASHVDVEHADELLATGYSCRSQTARLRGQRLRHPVEALLDAIRGEG
ncbi:D-2-hydroxyglutarate dehydrogenase YdiJ [Paraburkholderia tropica]